MNNLTFQRTFTDTLKMDLKYLRNADKMKIIIFVSGAVLAIFSTSVLSYTYKCKNEVGNFVYSDTACSQNNIEMHEETIAINGQRKLTKEQVRVIDEHHKQEQHIRNWAAEQLLATNVDKLRKIEADKLRENENKIHKWF